MPPAVAITDPAPPSTVDGLPIKVISFAEKVTIEGSVTLATTITGVTITINGTAVPVVPEIIGLDFRLVDVLVPAGLVNAVVTVTADSGTTPKAFTFLAMPRKFKLKLNESGKKISAGLHQCKSCRNANGKLKLQFSFDLGFTREGTSGTWIAKLPKKICGGKVIRLDVGPSSSSGTTNGTLVLAVLPNVSSLMSDNLVKWRDTTWNYMFSAQRTVAMSKWGTEVSCRDWADPVTLKIVQ